MQVGFQLFATDKELLQRIDAWRFKYRLHAVAEEFGPPYRQRRLEEPAAAGFQINQIWLSPDRFTSGGMSANARARHHLGALSVYFGGGTDAELYQSLIGAVGEESQLALWRRVVRAAKRDLHRQDLVAQTAKGPIGGGRFWCTDGALDFARCGGILRLARNTIAYRLP